MRVSPTLVEDLLGVVGRPYHGVDHIVLDDIHECASAVCHHPAN